jgi:alpha-D-ribose 1-methylphosphonate 5-phosphate C-P lyase
MKTFYCERNRLPGIPDVQDIRDQLDEDLRSPLSPFHHSIIDKCCGLCGQTEAMFRIAINEGGVMLVCRDHE